jgi:hypothetical protein
MFLFICSYCDETQRINRELERHTMTCEVKRSTKRRKISRRAATTSRKINVENARNDFAINDIQKQNVFSIDESDQSSSRNDDFTTVLKLSNENASISTNSNDDIYDLFDLQIELSIYSTTSTFRVQTYEEEIDRRAEICISFNEDHVISQDYQFRNESDQINEFFFFNNSADYDLTL